MRSLEPAGRIEGAIGGTMEGATDRTMKKGGKTEVPVLIDG